MHEPSFTWSGHLPPKIYKNPIYSNKVFLGGVPWDITEGIFKTYPLLIAILASEHIGIYFLKNLKTVFRGRV